MRRFVFLVPLAILSFLVGPPAARAEMIQYSDFGESPPSTEHGGFEKLLSIPKFDPALGPLFAVQVDLAGTAWQSINVQKQETPRDYWMTTAAEFWPWIPERATPRLLTAYASDTRDVHVEGSEFPSEFEVVYHEASGQARTLLLAPEDRDLFTGSGHANLWLDAMSMPRSSPGMPFDVNHRGAAAGVTVSYYYGDVSDVIPEPGTGLLLALGAVGALPALRRRARDVTARETGG